MPEEAPSNLRLCTSWALLAMAFYLVFCGFFFQTAGRDDVAWFVHFGKQSSAIHLAYEVLGRGVRVPHIDGHDGQAFWVVARDPLLLHPKQTAGALDRPAYRAQRIAYPLLAAPWRVFGERGLLWGMVLTNLAIVGVGTGFAAALALDIGAPARASLAFAFNPAVIVGVIFDMSDVLAIACVVALVYFLRRGRWGPAIAAGTIATLAKEPSLFAIGALAVLAPGFPRPRRISLVAIPAAAAGVWSLYMRWRLSWPSSQIQEFAAPFYGFYDAYRRGWRPEGNWWDGLIAVLTLVVAVAIVALWWKRRTSLLMIAALPYALLIPIVSGQVLDLADNSLRALGPALTFLIMELYVAPAVVRRSSNEAQTLAT